MYDKELDESIKADYLKCKAPMLMFKLEVAESMETYMAACRQAGSSFHVPLTYAAIEFAGLISHVRNTLKLIPGFKIEAFDKAIQEQVATNCECDTHGG